MSRLYRKKILNEWALLGQCYNACVQNFSEKSSTIVLDTLVTCQDAAYVIGNNLERHWGEETPVVSQIGSLCESLYICHEKILEGTISKHDWACVQDEIKAIEKQLELNLSDKIEMAFLPYKASMWDSLESVWKAACKREECEVYVVPIPYFDKTEEGGFGQEHYEIDQYPDDVPTINYEEYNMEERCPDIVFIHNPYDDYNRVTTIHPNYYVKELKQYVGKVVYIPYYVSNEFNPSDLIVQRTKEPFIMTPGVIFSDYTIVQSENMKRLYINVLEKKCPDSVATNWEKRILGLGSPKVDRVLQTRRDDNRLPKEWKEKIYGLNGKRKRVVFYNTSLADLLNCDNMLDKIEDTLQFFEKQEDVVLWWRPHPLYEETLESILPMLVERYHAIIKKYKDNKIGIFDTGMDLDWAIAETDAYYGDGSSVSILFKYANKPVMYQDAKIKNCSKRNKSIPMWPCAYYTDDNAVWFIHGRMNMLFKLDLNTLQYELIGSVPEEKLFQAFLYTGIVKYKQRIILVPGFAKNLAIYDVAEKKFKKIKITTKEKDISSYLFEEAEVWKNWLICYPYNASFLLKINLDSLEMKKINLLGEKESEENVTFYSRARVKNNVYMVCDKTNSIIKVNLDADQLSVIKSPNDERYTKIAALGTKIVLFSSETQEIILLDKNEKKKVLLCVANDIPFRMRGVGDRILLTENVQGKRTCIDVKGEIVSEEEKKTGKTYSLLNCNPPMGILGNHLRSLRTYFDTSEYSLFLYEQDGIKDCIKFEDYKFEELLLDEMTVDETELFSLENWINTLRSDAIGIDNHENVGENIINQLKLF